VLACLGGLAAVAGVALRVAAPSSGGPAGHYRPGLASHSLHLVLVGATLAVGPRVPGASRDNVVVLREALGSLLVVVAEVAGAGILHSHERAAGVGQSSVSPHWCQWT
jgi:hypothetical protein